LDCVGVQEIRIDVTSCLRQPRSSTAFRPLHFPPFLPSDGQKWRKGVIIIIIRRQCRIYDAQKACSEAEDARVTPGRGGGGERRWFRDCLAQMAEDSPEISRGDAEKFCPVFAAGADIAERCRTPQGPLRPLRIYSRDIPPARGLYRMAPNTHTHRERERERERDTWKLGVRAAGRTAESVDVRQGEKNNLGGREPPKGGS